MNEQQNTELEATQSAGDIMAEGAQRALKKIVILLGILVYLSGVIYAEVHGLNVLSKGVNPDFLMWAYIGMVALGVTAVALPLALHVWCFEAMHRIAAFVFYALDIALLGINSFVDFGVNVGEALPQWAQMYADFVMPATPVIAAVGWSVLFLLDPAAKATIMGHTLRASIREALSQRIITAAKGENVSEAVDNAARLEVDRSLTDLFGQRAIVTPPKRYEQTSFVPPILEDKAKLEYRQPREERKK
jgi:hypothetical protein